MRKLAWWVLIKFPSLRFLPINPLGNNAGEHNESVVPIKCIDGQLGSGRLIDFAMTSGRPAGPWHAYRLMSPFTCKFKEIMRASPRKFTHTHIDTRTQKRRRHPRPVETGGLLKSPCNIFFWVETTRPEEFGFISVVRSKSLGVHSLWSLNRKSEITGPPCYQPVIYTSIQAGLMRPRWNSLQLFPLLCHPSLTSSTLLKKVDLKKIS